MIDLDIDEVKNYYKEHTLYFTALHFGVSKYQLKKFMIQNGIELQDANVAKSLGWLEVLLNKVDETKFKNYYADHTINETMAKFHISRKSIKKLFELFNIIPRTGKEARAQGIKNYLSNPNNKNARNEKIKSTMLEKYGVEYAAQLSDFENKKKKTIFERYGVEYPLQNKELLEKASNTCLEKYGVAYPCLRDEANVRGRNSKPNKEFANLLTINNILFTTEFNIGKFGYDFKVGDILIEINPTATHNSTWGIFDCAPTKINYHQLKSNLAMENGFQCIHVWDWDDKEKIIKLLQPKEKIYARKCTIKETSLEEAKNFLIENHIQGYVKSKINIGLYYNNKLISIMTFGTPRYNRKYQFELLRYCSSANIVGGAEKLFKFFLMKYEPTSIISYCDLSKFTGNVYARLGFIEKQGKISPSKHWVNINNNKHITNNLLNQRGFDQLLGKEYGYYGKGTSNKDLMLQHGFVEIYDCGQKTYYWNKSN